MSVGLLASLAKKRDGEELTAAEIGDLIAGYMRGDLADYQMSAFLMAVFLRGMSDAETVALMRAMLESGTVLDLGKVPGFKVDKHSTGGVGDKVSISLAPLVAACGVKVPMVSGRGLGHTGGTLDKLEAIPGFRVDLSLEDFTRTVERVGCSMIGQTQEIAPADKRIYALRDVTATVESIPLIVASILSKKLAEGIDGLVLDVKSGRGAFMKSEADARQLAQALVRVGTLGGKKVVALLTRMDAPLGTSIGNACETKEAIELLHGRSPADLLECTLSLGAEMLVMGGAASSVDSARVSLEKAISSGDAVRVLEKMIEAHGGDPRVAAHPDRLVEAPHAHEIRAARAGWVTGIDALALGQLGVALGAGRTRADQPVDHGVGIYVMKKVGEKVVKDDVLAIVRVRSDDQAQVATLRAEPAFSIGAAAPASAPLVIGRIAGAANAPAA